MIDTKTLDFLQNLTKNNNKIWFDTHKAQYQDAKDNFEQAIQFIITYLQKQFPAYQNITPKDCMFRINRDVRFSHNKLPYKTNLGASIKIGGKKSPYCGFYFHLEAEKSFFGGGYYAPEAPILKNIRQEIDFNAQEFTNIISEKNFKKLYLNSFTNNEKLVNPPKGYQADNEMIAYLKLKHFTALTQVSDAELQSPKKLQSSLLLAIDTLNPFIEFLNKAVE